MADEAIPMTRTIALGRVALNLATPPDAPFTVRLLAGGRRLTVSYDLRRIDRAGVEAALAAAGLALTDGPWIRLGRRWSAFREGNLRAQANIVHRCCSDPPE